MRIVVRNCGAVWYYCFMNTLSSPPTSPVSSTPVAPTSVLSTQVAPLTVPPPRRRTWLWVGVAAGVVLVVLAALAFLYGDQLGAAVIGAKGKRLAVRRGETHTVLLPRSSTLKNVELCRGKVKQTCVVLQKSVAGVQTKVAIPAKYPLGSATVVVSDVKPVRVLYRRAVLIVNKPVPPVVIDEGGGGSGGGGGGNDGGGGGSGQPAPDPYEPQEPPQPDPYGPQN